MTKTRCSRTKDSPRVGINDVVSNRTNVKNDFIFSDRFLVLNPDCKT